jgi:glycyl-tRNA synthetase
VLGETVLPKLAAGLTFDRSMRWLPEADAGRVAFSRPVRWIVALHGSHVVPFAFAGLRAGATTRGLRFDSRKTIRLKDASAYVEALHQQGIELSRQARRQRIWDQATKLAASVRGHLAADDELLSEVADLVEAPSALLGSFAESQLELPEPVLVAVMKKHQRYFPVRGGDGTLLPYFVAVANGERPALDEVRRGNEQVIRARFADAAYFIRRDLERPLEAYVPQLERIAFQAKLGSVYAKVQRLGPLVEHVAEQLDLSKEERATARRAALLAKADMATAMVVEMTSLQGEMGRTYALHSGEPEAVAEAIYQHYLPRFAGDAIPTSRPALAVGLADRLDTLVGLFAVGLQPTGTRDPMGLRRTAIGLIQCLVGWRQRFDLRIALEPLRSALHPVAVSDEAFEACLAFVGTRQEALLLADGWPHDVVQAVLAAQRHDPARAAAAVEALAQAVREPGWPPVLQAYARCVRILRTAERPSTDPQRRTLPAEKALDSALRTAEAEPREVGSVPDLLRAFLPLVPAITTFFDDVLVMSEDPNERSSRLALVGRIVDLADGVADFSRLEGF